MSSEPKNLRLLVPVALFAAVASISLAASLFLKAAPTHPLVMAGIRLSVAAVCLAPFVVRAWRRGRLNRKMVLGALGAGVAYGVHFGAWVSSLTLTSVAASVTLVTTTPILLAAASMFTGRDRPDQRLWFSLGIAILGVALIGGHDGLFATGALAGDALAFLGAASIAVYFTIARRMDKDMDLLAFSGIATAVGAALLMGTAAVAGLDLKPASTEAFWYLVAAAIVPQLIGHNLLTWALRHATPTQVAMAVVGEPAGATLVAWLWLGAAMAPLVALGCAVTLIAVAVAATMTRQNPGSS